MEGDNQMKYKKVIIELHKIVLLEIEEDNHIELRIRKMIEQMIDKDRVQGTALSAYGIEDISFEWIEKEALKFTLVKKAIDALDPYCVHLDAYDEYDGESRRIAKKIVEGMSEEGIAKIMKEEFNWSFSADFTIEDFMTTAKTVYDLLKDCSQEEAKTEDGVMRKFAYIVVKMSKIMPMIDSDDEHGKEKEWEIAFDELDDEDRKSSALSFFSISGRWIEEMEIYDKNVDGVRLKIDS